MDTIKILKGNVKMIAHRGLSKIERENTCAAFVAAGNRSYFGIETDVRKTSDGQLIIMHDPTPRRVTNGVHDIDIPHNPYSAIKDVVLPDIDGSFNRQDLRIPFLLDYIKICKKYEKYAVLELKTTFNEEEMRRIIDVINGEEYLDKVIFISFVLANCLLMRKLLPEQTIQWLIMKELPENLFKILEENRFDLDIQHSLLTQEIVDKVHSLGLKVNSWTCDTEEVANRLVELGIDYITTNILE